MGANPRTKGQAGEREVATMLNKLVDEVRLANGFESLETRDALFQRNQNQSAVGGSDLSNPIYLEIEVKRQEALSVNTWWKQCVESAARTGGIPILIYRQNRKAWKVCIPCEIPLQPFGSDRYKAVKNVRGEISLDDFKDWFICYYTQWVS